MKPILIGATALLAGLAALVVLSSLAHADSVNSTIANLPDNRDQTAAVWTGSTAWIFGGQGDQYDSTGILQFDPTTGTVTRDAAHLPFGLKWPSAVWNGTAAFLFGGENASADTRTYSDDIYRFDPLLDTVTLMNAHLPERVTESAAVWTGTNAYIIGGLKEDGSTSADTITQYDPVTDTATVVAHYPTDFPYGATSRAMGVVWNGSAVLLLGGTNNDHIVAFDPATNVVTDLGRVLPNSVYAPCAAYGDGYAWLIGDQDADGVNVLRVDTSVVPSIVTVMDAKLPRSQDRASCVWNGTAVFTFGGIDNTAGDLFLSNVTKYDPAPNAPASPDSAPQSDGKVKLTWQPPSPTSYSHPLQGYRVLRAPIDGLLAYGVNAYTTVATVGADVLSAVDVPMTPGNFAYAVTAFNQDGESPVADAGQWVIIPGFTPVPISLPEPPPPPAVDVLGLVPENVHALLEGAPDPLYRLGCLPLRVPLIGAYCPPRNVWGLTNLLDTV